MTDYPFSQPNGRRNGSIEIQGTMPPTGENLLQQLVKQCGRDSHKYFPIVLSAQGAPYGRLFHDALACAGEIGELVEIVKKIDRGSLQFDNEGVKAALETEAVDVFIYLMNIFHDLDIDPLKAFLKKRDFNNERFIK
jgi:NTP pyrophosphatase (non-canonical NTP hydrolase)